MVTWTDYYNKDYKDPFGNPITCSEWYKTHDSAKPFRDRIMKAVHASKFKSKIWKPTVSKMKHRLDMRDVEETWEQVFHLVNEVRKDAGMPLMKLDFFEEGKYYRAIFIKPYKYALQNFWLLCWGDW